MPDMFVHTMWRPVALIFAELSVISVVPDRAVMHSVVIGAATLTTEFGEKWIWWPLHRWRRRFLAFSVVTKLKPLLIGADQLLVEDVAKDLSDLVRFLQFMSLIGLSPRYRRPLCSHLPWTKAVIQ